MIAILSIIILVILVGRAIYIVKSEKASPQRGTDPGDGETEIVSEYSSGVGGGQHRTYMIPKDPEKYAQIFVPKDRK